MNRKRSTRLERQQIVLIESDRELHTVRKGAPYPIQKNLNKNFATVFPHTLLWKLSTQVFKKAHLLRLPLTQVPYRKDCFTGIVMELYPGGV